MRSHLLLPSAMLAVVIGFPGVIFGGFLLGFSICDPFSTGPIQAPPPITGLWFIPFAALFWFGLRVGRQALYAIVILPTPVVLGSGIYLMLSASSLGIWVFTVGLVFPVAAGLVVSAHYRNIRLRPTHARHTH